jgi:5-formyltetrahydrofolate cyclo-ligase
MLSKRELRERIRLKLQAQSPQERREKGLRISERLFALPEFKKAAWVSCYVALPEEVDTVPMIEKAIGMGKRVSVPLVDLENKVLETYEIKNLSQELKKGAFGIFEPDPKKTCWVDPGLLELVVVPGLLFDKANKRLGRGGGFYDRFQNAFLRWVFRFLSRWFPGFPPKLTTNAWIWF